MKKSKRILQFTAASLSILLALLLAAYAMLALIPYLTAESGAFISVIKNGIDSVAAIFNISGPIFICVALVLPAIVLIISAALLFSAPERKRKKALTASVLGIIFTVLPAALFALLGSKLLNEALPFAAAALSVLPAIIAVLLVISLCLRPKKRTEKLSVLPGDSLQRQTAFTKISPLESEEIVPDKGESAKEEEPLYSPKDTETVKDIVEKTYGKNVESDKDDVKTIAQLKRVRDLYEQGVLTEYEYDELVKRFLHSR